MLIDEKSATLIQGVFTEPFFEFLVRRHPRAVVVMEGRPSLRAADVAGDGLLRQGITPVLIADNMAGFLFARGLVKEVWLACRLSDQNGVLCEIGALVVAVLARRHKVPVFCFPTTGETNFLGRSEALFKFRDIRVAAAGVKAYVPLWEWVPRKYVKKIYSGGCPEHARGVRSSTCPGFHAPGRWRPEGSSLDDVQRKGDPL